MSMKEKHPVITGFGIVCCLGRNKDEVKENLMKGQTMFRPVSDKCDLGQLNDYLVGLCPVDEPAVNTANDYDKSEIMIRMTADEAFKDAGFDGDFSAFEERAAVSLATSLMGSEYLVKYSEKNSSDAKWLINSKKYATKLAKEWNIGGGVYTTSSACASGSAAVGIAADLIKSDTCDVVLCGGSDFISEISLNGFDILQTLSHGSCKPFDNARDGINIGEGSAFFVIEEYSRAVKHGAKIYGEIKGCGLANDAYHITSPDPSGAGAYHAMKAALGGDIPENIYINAHGTGTSANDAMELKAVRDYFSGKNVYMSSTKSLTGHCLGAAGSIELAFSLMFLDDGRIRHTANSRYDLVDDDNITDKMNENETFTGILSNSFAFGGNDASLYIVKA